jgi:general secretion pathway protein C
MKHYRAALILLTLTGLVYFSVDMLTGLVAHRLEAGSELRDRKTGSGKAEDAGFRPFAEYAVVAERNLFGGGEQLAALKQQPPPPQTSLADLGLKLVGTVQGLGKEPGYAVLNLAKQNRQAVFREGATVEGAVLKQVGRRQVVLTLNGRDEVLGLEVSTGPVPLPPPPPAKEEQTITIKASEIDAALKDWSELVSGLQVKAVSRGNPAQGYRIVGIANWSILKKLGIGNNDTIKGVNGQPLTGVKQLLDTYKAARQGGKIELDLDHLGGEQKRVTYKIEKD